MQRYGCLFESNLRTMERARFETMVLLRVIAKRGQAGYSNLLLIDYRVSAFNQYLHDV